MVTTMLAVMLGLLLLSAYFSATEAALFSLSRLERYRLRQRRDRNSRGILQLLRQPAQTLTTLLVGNNLVNIALSSIATVFFISILGGNRNEAVELSTVVVTVLVLLFGEIASKTVAVNSSLKASRLLSGSLLLARRLMRPATRGLYSLSMALLKMLGIEEGSPIPGALVSRSELRAVLEDVDGETAVITRGESRLVQNILDFSRRTAEQIMTPRVDVIDIDVDLESGKVTQLMRESRHSRYPVYEGDPDNVLGFVSAKEALLGKDKELRELIRPVVFFPGNAAVDHIFSEIQSSQTAMVMVVNEYGEMLGLITREDVIEEIVGDIYDEFDLEEAPIKKKGKGLYIVRGRYDISELNEELGLELPAESSVTLNGFVCEVHGHIPRPGTVVTWKELRFHVLEVARHQVRKVLLEIPVPEEESS